MKTYECPVLLEEVVEIEDIVAASFGGNQPGDVEHDWPWIG